LHVLALQRVEQRFARSGAHRQAGRAGTSGKGGSQLPPFFL